MILEAAAKLFRRQGYSATTLRQIAAMAEIKAGSIYYYFDSKEAILDEVLHRGLLGVFDAVKTALKRAGKVSHRRRIGLAIEAHLVALLEASDFTSANIRIYGQLPEHLKKPHRPLRRAYARYWDRLFLDARRAGEIRADIEIVPLRIFVLGALNWTIEWFGLNSRPVGVEACPPYRAPDLRRGQESLTWRRWRLRRPSHRMRLATSSSITSVVPPPIDCTRASRDIRSMVLSRM